MVKHPQFETHHTAETCKMVHTHKRSFSPTIDDIRQFNIKRQRVLEDFDLLELRHSNRSPPSELNRPLSSQHTEFIPDIDEFLLLNQDDRDVLESSRLVQDFDYEALKDVENLVIPDLTLVPLTKEQLKRSVSSVRSSGNSLSMTSVLEEFDKLEHWCLVPYKAAQLVVYEHWAKYWIDHSGSSDDAMDVDVADVNVAAGQYNNAYGGYYKNDTSLGDVMDID